MIIKLPKDVQLILSELNNAGYKAYVVGGCIRDRLLGLRPKDWDVTTNATPEQTMKVFKVYKIIPTGIKHGTITVMINDEGYEITTFRAESEYDEHRRPEKVVFIDDIKEDLARRDFTINAIAYHPEEGLIDPFNGAEDLVLKKIKTVRRFGEEINARFIEDPLRAYRAFRFAARYGFEICSGTLIAIESLEKEDFKCLSKERIRDEISKIILYNPLMLDRMSFNMLDVAFPDLIYNLYVKQNHPYHIYNVYVHTMKAIMECYDSLELRLATLLHDVGKRATKTVDDSGITHFYGHPEKSAIMAEKYLKDLRYDNKTVEKVVTVIKYHDCELNSKKAIKRMVSRIGIENFELLLDLKTVDILAQNPKYKKERMHQLWDTVEILNEIRRNNECIGLKDLAIKGGDLIRLGMKEGPEIGQMLFKLLDKVLENPELNNKDDLIKLYNELKDL